MDGERAHVGNQIAVAEGEAALANENIFLFGSFSALSTTFFISPGERNWPFLMFTGRPAEAAAWMKSVWRQRKAGVCSTSTTAADRFHLFLGMHVGQHGDAYLALHFRKYFRPASMPRPRKDLPELRFALSYDDLKISGMPSGRQISSRATGGVDLQLARLDDAGTRDGEKAVYPNRPRNHRVSRRDDRQRAAGRFALARCLSAAVTKALNRGWPARGVEVNSGWNCTPTKKRMAGDFHHLGQLLARRTGRHLVALRFELRHVDLLTS